MKKHLVSFTVLIGAVQYNCTGFVDEVIGDNGKPIFYPNALFKKCYGFDIPVGTAISIG